MVASSLVVTPTPLFPLLSGDHTYFLTGFSNARSTSNSTPAVITPASIPDSTKRAAKPEPVLPNKKLRSNAPTMPVGSIPISTIATPPLSSVPLAPQGFTPTQSNKSLQPPHRPPSAHRSPRVPQQVLDGYVENMAVGNTFPNGGPVPTTNFAEVQAALAAYNPPPQQSQPPQQTQLPAPSQASQPPPQVNGNQRPLSAANLTPAQLSSLPQLSPEVMAKIQELLGECKDRLARGEVTKEQSAQEVRQLKDTMDGSVAFCLAYIIVMLNWMIDYD